MAGVKKVLAVVFAAALALAATGCGTVDQAVCDDVRVLENQLGSVEGDLQPEVAQEVRDDYAEIATAANCPGYDEADDE